MSLGNWKAEFMPRPAHEAAKEGTLAAIDHALLKWQGMQEENLNRHGLTSEFGGVTGTRIYELEADEHPQVRLLSMGANNCTLCVIYNSQYGPLGRGKDLDCRGCPLGFGDGPDMTFCWSNNRGYDQVLAGKGPDVLISELQRARENWLERYGETGGFGQEEDDRWER